MIFDNDTIKFVRPHRMPTAYRGKRRRPLNLVPTLVTLGVITLFALGVMINAELQIV